jgi:hypothetical protein
MEVCRSEILLAARVQKLEKQLKELKELVQAQTSHPQSSTITQELLEQAGEALLNRLLSGLVESLGTNLRKQLQSQLEPLLIRLTELEIRNEELEAIIGDRQVALNAEL